MVYSHVSLMIFHGNWIMGQNNGQLGITQCYSTIIYESYVDGKPTISSDMGMEMAFVEYCIDQLDHAFLATPKRALMARHR